MTSLVSGRDDAAVVAGVADVYAGSNGAEQGIGENLGVGRLVAALGGIVHDDSWLVLVDEQAELVSCGTLVVDFNRKCAAKLTLNAEAVLINVRTAKVLVFGAETHQADLVGLADILYERNVLIETDGIGEFSTWIGCSLWLRNAGYLRGSNVKGRIQGHIRRDIVENLVIADAESAADDGFVIAKHRGRDARGVSETEDGSDVVLIYVRP